MIYVSRAALPGCRCEVAAEARGLVTLARSLGWPKARIKIVQDLGHASGRRPGFRRILELVEHRKVGIVVARDISRFSRNPVDLAQFLQTAARAGVLIVVNGRVLDLAFDPATQLVSRFASLYLRQSDTRQARILRGMKRPYVRVASSVSRARSIRVSGRQGSKRQE